MSYRSSMCLFIVFMACFVVLGCASNHHKEVEQFKMCKP